MTDLDWHNQMMLSVAARRGVWAASPSISCRAQRPLAAAARRRRHEKRYQITGDGCGTAAAVTARGHKIFTDVPRSGGGDDAAAQPVELLLAALIGCETATASFVARQLGVSLGSVAFELDAVRDTRGSAHVPVDAPAPAPSRLSRITGVARVTTDDPGLDVETLERLGRIVHARCPVANMMDASGCALEIDWRLATLPPGGAAS